MTSVVLDNNYTESFLMAALNEKLLRVGHNEDSGFIKMRLERQQNCYLSTLYTTIMIHDHIILATPQMYGGEMLIDGPLVENQTVSFPSEEEYKKSLDVIEPLPLFCGLDELIDFLRESGVSISTDEFSRFEATLDEMETERTRRFGQRSVQDIKLENIVQRMLSGKNIINDDDLDFIDKYERWNRRWVQAERSIMELNSQIRRANDISGNILNSNLSAIRNRNIKEESYLRIASGKVIVNFDELDRNDLFRVAALQLGVAPYAETLVATLKMANSPEAIDFRLRIDELSQNCKKVKMTNSHAC